MNTRFGEQGIIGLAIAYLVALSWSISNISYDIWGVFIVLPPLALLGIFGVRRMFSGELQPIAKIMYLGLAAKFAGACAKYFVSFDTYGGFTDAEEYHIYARAAASKVWGGQANISTVLPGGTGTHFMERFTSFLYTLVGSSKLAGYFVFAWMAFWGIAFFVKAGCIAIPRLAQRRYAVLCVLAPSIVYWPSSIGKEALMMFALGIGTHGIARLLARSGFFQPLVLVLVGLGLAGLVRPHMAAIWLAALLPTLLMTLFRGRQGRDQGRGAVADRFVLLVIIGLAAVALVAVGSATVRYLHPSSDEKASGNTITAILKETTRRTSKAGSNFTPPAINGPTDWAKASVRTLLRPLLIEANGVGQLLSAVELTAFILLCMACYRRVLNVPRLLLTNPFVVFAIGAIFLVGLAYSSFGNLGVLTRQKSLILPLMFLIPCVPVRSYRRDPERAEDVAQNNSTSPSVRPQLDSGGIPASLTARQVRTGPPWGNGAKPAVGRG